MTCNKQFKWRCKESYPKFQVQQIASTTRMNNSQCSGFELWWSFGACVKVLLSKFLWKLKNIRKASQQLPRNVSGLYWSELILFRTFNANFMFQRVIRTFDLNKIFNSQQETFWLHFAAYFAFIHSSATSLRPCRTICLQSGRSSFVYSEIELPLTNLQHNIYIQPPSEVKCL